MFKQSTSLITFTFFSFPYIDLHILAVNHEIGWSAYKWLDIHGHGMRMRDGGLDHVTGYCYEPIAYSDRVFDARPPEPGKEIAVISEKWGEYGSDVKCKYLKTIFYSYVTNYCW